MRQLLTRKLLTIYDLTRSNDMYVKPKPIINVTKKQAISLRGSAKWIIDWAVPLTIRYATTKAVMAAIRLRMLTVIFICFKLLIILLIYNK